jgi:hypothetical protein
MTTYPLYLLSRNPEVKSVKDFTPKLPAHALRWHEATRSHSS